MNNFSIIFLCALSLSTATKVWLAFRHISFIKQNSGNVPPAFSGDISLESHQKAANYSIAKTKLSFVSVVIDALLLLAFTFGGLFQVMDNIAMSIFDNEIYRGVLFLILLVAISSFVDLPISLYRTFGIEVKFGFNKTTFKTWSLDLIKNILVGLILGLPLIWLVLTLMGFMGNHWWIYVWVVMVLFVGLIQFIGPTYIAPLFNKFTPLEDGSLKSRVESLLLKCGFESDGLFVMDGSKRSSHGNAYFTGFGKNKRIVFFDTLLERLKISEIEAVLAHELGHFHLKHVVKRLLMLGAISALFLLTLAILKNQEWFYLGLNMEVSNNNGVALGLFFLIAPVFTFILQPLFSRTSRKHEFQADAYASKFTPSKDLISALVKLYDDNASTLTPDPIYSAWYDSHPTATTRIQKLQSL